LGEIIYRYITAEQFSPECLLDCLDLSSEHHTLEVANRIEAAIHVWRLKGQKKLTPQAKSKKTWGGKVKGLVGDKDKSHTLSERADGLLQSLRLRYPGLPQTSLDMNKIQYNKVKYSFVASTIDNIQVLVFLENYSLNPIIILTSLFPIIFSRMLGSRYLKVTQGFWRAWHLTSSRGLMM
jgi:hypothetical protein